MKTLQLPDDLPIVAILRFVRENELSLRWIGDGVYSAERMPAKETAKARWSKK